jgi:hypothetical protein
MEKHPRRQSLCRMELLPLFTLGITYMILLLVFEDTVIFRMSAARFDLKTISEYKIVISGPLLGATGLSDRLVVSS